MSRKPKQDQAQQTEMVEVGKRDAIGRLAIGLLDARSALETAKETVESAASELIEAMHQAERSEIRVEGLTITLRHVDAQDVLKIKKPKQTASQ